MHRSLAVLTLLLSLPAMSMASSVSIGLISFDVLIQGGIGPGVNAFSVYNLTGDPGLGGFALPPDFPSLDSITLVGSTLTLMGPSPTMVALGNIGPGVSAPFSLEFSDVETFTSAVFSASLSQTTFSLDGGGSFSANAPTVTAILSPLSGTSLVPGTDFALLTVSDDVPVPEPAGIEVLPWGLAALAGLHLRHKRVAE